MNELGIGSVVCTFVTEVYYWFPKFLCILGIMSMHVMC